MTFRVMMIMIICFQFEPSHKMKDTHFIKIYDTPILNLGEHKDGHQKPETELDTN